MSKPGKFLVLKVKIKRLWLFVIILYKARFPKFVHSKNIFNYQQNFMEIWKKFMNFYSSFSLVLLNLIQNMQLRPWWLHTIELQFYLVWLWLKSGYFPELKNLLYMKNHQCIVQRVFKWDFFYLICLNFFLLVMAKEKKQLLSIFRYRFNENIPPWLTA